MLGHQQGAQHGRSSALLHFTLHPSRLRRLLRVQSRGLGSITNCASNPPMSQFINNPFSKIEVGGAL